MKNSELNEYILHYLKEDRTKSAIMLTANWGTGKSYYIQKELIPFLSKDENGNFQCIVVSLYGLESLDEISKIIYLESRMKFLSKDSEKAVTGKIIAKVVAKGVMSKALGVDLSPDSDDFQKLYQSIDLSNKLIILEDIERSKIDILGILGYVNNLTEQDNAKVLLIANEQELLKYHYSEPDNKGKTYQIPDDTTMKYLRAKEKTISDTINFVGDMSGAVSNIIHSFKCNTLDTFDTEEEIERIIGIMKIHNSSNLRSLLFACQKTFDIYEKLGSIDCDIARTIFFSIISFSMKIKNGYFPEWDGTNYISIDLGIRDMPLYRLCYDYIRWQKFDPRSLLPALEEDKRMKLYNKNGGVDSDEDLSILINYPLFTENEVRTSFENINARLSDPDAIPIYSYNKLAYTLVVLSEILGLDYSPCKKNMIQNLKKNGKEIDPNILFINSFEFDSEQIRKKHEEYLDFLQDLKKAVNESKENPFNFSYSPEHISSLKEELIQHETQAIEGRLFISKFDLDCLTDMLFSCNPFQLNEWRSVLNAIYRHSHKNDFLQADYVFMRKLKERITDILSTRKAEMDKIVLLQMNYLIADLQKFINQLS
ncbi:MAG: hypothetical protein HDT27_00660 [Subdoligranulum sp.]|nr:hypothetical protein [Subdoligranulum sp.]